MAAKGTTNFPPKNLGYNPSVTVENKIFYCGVTYGALFNDDKKLDRMADEIFDDDFFSCMDKTNEEFDKGLRSYSNLMVVNGYIRI